MLTLDYNSAIFYQYQETVKSKKRLDLFSYTKWLNSLISLHTLLRGLNNHLTSQLLQTEGTLAKLRENYAQFENKDVTKGIKYLNDNLKLNIHLHSRIENILQEPDINEKYPELFASKEILDATIENLYATIRLLKRANLKTSKETSELAKALSAHSLNSLEKTIYGR